MAAIRKKAGTPLSPEPKVLRTIGKESRRKGTDKLSSARIDQIIKASRMKAMGGWSRY